MCCTYRGTVHERKKKRVLFSFFKIINSPIPSRQLNILALKKKQNWKLDDLRAKCLFLNEEEFYNLTLIFAQVGSWKLFQIVCLHLSLSICFYTFPPFAISNQVSIIPPLSFVIIISFIFRFLTMHHKTHSDI